MLKAAFLCMIVFMLDVSLQQEEKCTSPCLELYKNLNATCYQFVIDVNNYFLIPDVLDREPLFTIREAAIYICYQKCRDIVYTREYYIQGVKTEKYREENLKNGGNGTPPANSPAPTSPPSSGTTPGNSPTPPPATPTPPP